MKAENNTQLLNEMNKKLQEALNNIRTLEETNLALSQKLSEHERRKNYDEEVEMDSQNVDSPYFSLNQFNILNEENEDNTSKLQNIKSKNDAKRKKKTEKHRTDSCDTGKRNQGDNIPNNDLPQVTRKAEHNDLVDTPVIFRTEEKDTPRQKDSCPSQANPKKDRPPPIVIKQQEPKDTISLVQEELKIKDFHVKQIHVSKHILYLQNVEDHKKTIHMLKQVNAIFYTYTIKSEKPQTLLLKGLSGGYSEEEVLEELKKLQIPRVEFLKVARFKTRSSDARGSALPIFAIQMSPGSDVANMRKINRLLHQVIRWEKIIKNGPSQCHNCQEIGHTSINCHMQYRCVKCSEEHGPNGCKIKKGELIEREKLYCVNCQKFGHPASFKECPFIKRLKAKLQEKIISKRESANKKLFFINKKVNPNFSYAQATSAPEEFRQTEAPAHSYSSIESMLKTIMNKIENLERNMKENKERIDTIFDIFEK